MREGCDDPHSRHLGYGYDLRVLALGLVPIMSAVMPSILVCPFVELRYHLPNLRNFKSPYRPKWFSSPQMSDSTAKPFTFFDQSPMACLQQGLLAARLHPSKVKRRTSTRRRRWWTIWLGDFRDHKSVYGEAFSEAGNIAWTPRRAKRPCPIPGVLCTFYLTHWIMWEIIVWA